jgi:hypothetical protein
MTTLRKQAKEKSCWVCGEQRRRLFSMGKVLEQTSERELVFTIKKEWLCLPCFERRYFEKNDHAKVCEAEKLEQELAAKDKEIEGLKDQKEKLIDLFKNCRDATGYSDQYFRGMYNGIEWARSCLEDNEPQYKDSVEKSEPIYVPTCAEMTEGK